MSVRNFVVTCKVENVNLGKFSSFSGGEADSEESFDSPGGLDAREALGGEQTVSNVVISRRFKPERDTPIIRQIRPKRGWAEAVVIKQPIDGRKNPIGQPDVYEGILKRVKPSEHDANSSDVGRFEIEITVNGEIV